MSVWGDPIVVVSFPYARSRFGQPVMAMPLETYAHLVEPTIDVVIRHVLAEFEGVGGNHHKCQSMPSRNPDHYLLSRLTDDGPDRCHIVVREWDDVGYGNPYTRSLTLRYAGPFGEFQLDQARRLGGLEAVATATDEWCLGLRLAVCGAASLSRRPIHIPTAKESSW